MTEDAPLARAGYLPDVNDAEVLVFESAEGHVLEVQSGLHADVQDARLGMAGHCVVLNGSASYQAIESVHLDGDVLVLFFTPASQAEIGLSPVVRVRPDGVEPGEALAIIERMVAHGPFKER